MLSARMLTAVLRELDDHGLVECEVIATTPVSALTGQYVRPFNRPPPHTSSSSIAGRRRVGRRVLHSAVCTH